MHARFEDGAEFRWLNKKVLDSRVLDSMEDLSSWSFAGAGEMTLTEDHTKDGRHAVRIRSTSNIGAPNLSFNREVSSDQGKMTNKDHATLPSSPWCKSGRGMRTALPIKHFIV